MACGLKEPLFDTMAVVGVGLIGGSLGMAAKQNCLAGRVVGYGRNKPNLEDALRMGAIDSVAESVPDCVRDADIVFVCTPVRTVQSVLTEITNFLTEGAIVTDVGSTKREIAELGKLLIPQGRHFIGGHPMAGTEKSGSRYAFAELFRGATYVLTPDKDTCSDALARLSAFVMGLGANLEIMAPLDHDTAVAAISHLPHIIASSLMQVVKNSENKTGKSFKLAAGSFADLTRVASSSPELWRDISVTNADLICGEIDELVQQLEAFKSSLQSRDDNAVLNLFEKGWKIREEHRKKKR